MLVTFKSSAHADIVMFGDVAVKLLKLMGQSGQVPGALAPGEAGDILARLREALARQPDNSESAGSADKDGQSDPDEPPPVPLRNRALPLLDMLEAADAAGAPVLWE